MAQVPNATYEVSRKSAHWFQRRRFLNVWALLHLGHVTWTVQTNSFPHPIETPYVIWLQMAHVKTILLFPIKKKHKWPNLILALNRSDQIRVIIWTNYDRPQFPMLHTKIQDNRLSGSREEDFKRAFIIYGYGSHLGQVTKLIGKKNHFLSPESFQMKFGFKWCRSFWKKKKVWILKY